MTQLECRCPHCGWRFAVCERPPDSLPAESWKWFCPHCGGTVNGGVIAPSPAMFRALQIFALTPTIREWLTRNDPMALQQAELALAGHAAYTCQNCGKVYALGDLKDIQDYHERVSEGEPEPAGECPECGALCHLEEKGVRYLTTGTDRRKPKRKGRHDCHRR